MPTKKRTDRQMKVIDEGQADYYKGVAYDDCPYKVSDWGLGSWWQLGWNRAAAADKKRREAHEGGSKYG